MGRQMGILGHSHAWRVVLLVWGMVWFGPAADLPAGTLISPGAMDLIRKSAEPFGMFVSKVSAGALREKWLGGERKLDDERGTIGALRRRPRALRVTGRIATSRYRGQRKSPGRTCPPRRDQPRDQPGDQADDRYGSIWPDRRVEFAARHLHHRRRGLRRLCDRQVGGAASGRHVIRRPADRRPARYHQRRGPRRGHGPAGT